MCMVHPIGPVDSVRQYLLAWIRPKQSPSRSKIVDLDSRPSNKSQCLSHFRIVRMSGSGAARTHTVHASHHSECRPLLLRRHRDICSCLNTFVRQRRMLPLLERPEPSRIGSRKHRSHLRSPFRATSTSGALRRISRRAVFLLPLILGLFALLTALRR